jgi:hypothetical protein
MYEIITLKRKMNMRFKVNDTQRTLPLNKALMKQRPLTVSVCSHCCCVSMRETQEPKLNSKLSFTHFRL